MVGITARDRLRLLAGASGLLFGACGGSGSSSSSEFIIGGTPPTTQPSQPVTGLTSGLLRDTFRNNFLIGTASNNVQLANDDLSASIALDQFNSITPEWELKADLISPSEGVYNFDDADRVVDWAIANGMEVRGHALLWHEATPAWMLEGTPSQIRTKLESYIQTVMTHFQGRITVWDVCNECISTDVYNGSNGIGPDRRTPWFDAVGSGEYMEWAFLAARAADPNALLFMSDYNTENPIKRGYMVEILQRFSANNIPIDGFGHQFHLYLNTDSSEAMSSIDAVDNQFMGLVQHVTEMDMTVYNDPGSCWESETNCDPDLGETPPADILAQQAQLYRDMFNGLIMKSSVESVSFWGVRDGDSWLNFAPTERFNHPLLFDRNGDPKPAFHAITDQAYII